MQPLPASDDPCGLTTSKKTDGVVFGPRAQNFHCEVPPIPITMSDTFGPLTLVDTHGPITPHTVLVCMEKFVGKVELSEPTLQMEYNLFKSSSFERLTF